MAKLTLKRQDSKEDSQRLRKEQRLIDYVSSVSPADQDSPKATSTTPHLPSLQMLEELERTFWCFAKLRKVPLGTCLDSYVAHTAYRVETSDCTECSQGQWNRRCFARS